MTKLVWHDEECYSFDYSTGRWFIGMLALGNNLRQKYCYGLYNQGVCIAMFRSRDRAKRVARLIQEG